MESNIDLQAAGRHAQNCLRLAECISQTYSRWRDGSFPFRDHENYCSVSDLLDEADISEPSFPLALWRQTYVALRREYSAIEPLLREFGRWQGGIPFEKWLSGDGLPLSLYTSSIERLDNDAADGKIDDNQHRERIHAACDALFSKGASDDYRRARLRAGVAMRGENNEFKLAIDGVIRELNRRRTATNDGPIPGYRWRRNGIPIQAKMQTGAWKMVNFLWNQSDRSASFDDLKLPIYDDREHATTDDNNAFGGLRKAANRYFLDNNIPLIVEISARVVTLTPT